MTFYDRTEKFVELETNRQPADENSRYGRAVSRGVAVGTIVFLDGRERQFFRVEIKKNQVEAELLRLRRAVGIAAEQLAEIAAEKGKIVGDASANIFDAHLLILGDSSLLGKIEDKIKRRKINAEWAVKSVADLIIADYKSIADEHLRDRYIDLEDVVDRLLAALDGAAEKVGILLEKDFVIVAREIKPSTLIELADTPPKAIVTETGGWTSHTFILARAMNIPAVTGIDAVLRAVNNGEKIVVDGYEGKVIFNPNERVFRRYKTAAKQFQAAKSETVVPLGENLKTLDNREITVRANVETPVAYVEAEKSGARGIGLYRSEFLFNQTGDFPGEREQIEAYKKIADAAGADGVRIRTFDVSIGQTRIENSLKETNPALGLRALRLGTAHPNLFRTQLRALLQSATGNRKISIVLPMISDVSEIIEAKRILEEERERLKKLDIAVGNPPLGAMIEIPSAVFMIDEIARAVDFLSLGTNDLVQYLLAVDRDNPSVADWFRTLHPAVIRAVKKVITAAVRADIPVVVCGEMAGSPFYAPVLIGLGATDLSMNAGSIERVGKIIAGIAFEEAREIGTALEACATADEAEILAKNFFVEKWSHLFSPDMFPPAAPPKR